MSSSAIDQSPSVKDYPISGALAACVEEAKIAPCVWNQACRESEKRRTKPICQAKLTREEDKRLRIRRGLKTKNDWVDLPYAGASTYFPGVDIVEPCS